VSSAAANLIDAVDDGYATRDDIAACYAAVLRYDPNPDWPLLNRVILGRYAPSGLEYIKRKAWQLNEQIASPHSYSQRARDKLRRAA
jgi:hypothetical protein